MRSINPQDIRQAVLLGAALGRARSPKNIKQLAESTGIEVATLHRMLQIVTNMSDFVERQGAPAGGYPTFQLKVKKLR